MDPLKYGKLIEQINNKFYIQINKTNLAIITQENGINLVKFYREGDLVYNYKDIKIDNFSFERYLDNKKFTFKNNELILLTIDKSVKFINPLNHMDHWIINLLLWILKLLLKMGFISPM